MILPAFAVSLFIQSTSSYLMGVWFCFMCIYFYMKPYRITPLMGIWLGYLLIHALFVAPTFHMFATMPIEDGVLLRSPAFNTLGAFMALASIPLISFTRPHWSVNYGAGILLTGMAVYVTYLFLTNTPNIFQSERIVSVGDGWAKITGGKNEFGGVAGTLINRNNTACLMNVGLITSLGLFLRRDTIYRLLAFCLFLIALIGTDSRAGMITGVISSGILIAVLKPKLMGWAGLLLPTLPFVNWGGMVESFSDRIDIWKPTLGLIATHPMGTGMGTFGYMYEDVRTETHTAGLYAHNDLLQMAVELGIIAPLIFIGVLVITALRTTKANIIPACVILAITLQAMVEFQYYVPCIAILLGLAFSEHRKYGRHTP